MEKSLAYQILKDHNNLDLNLYRPYQNEFIMNCSLISSSVFPKVK